MAQGSGVERVNPVFIETIHLATNPLRWRFLEELALRDTPSRGAELRTATGISSLSTFFKVSQDLIFNRLVQRPVETEYQLSAFGAIVITELRELSGKIEEQVVLEQLVKLGLAGQRLERMMAEFRKS